MAAWPTLSPMNGPSSRGVRPGGGGAEQDPSYVRRPEKLQPVIERTYREYPNFCRAMARRAEQYNTCRERLFQLEREGRVLVLAPVSTTRYPASSGIPKS